MSFEIRVVLSGRLKPNGRQFKPAYQRPGVKKPDGMAQCAMTLSGFEGAEN
ncbi:hypothetical protein [Acidovorax radicis]|uniref:hypothetical protein n=1 Tax=Acidovorax radicis TaxID=758826 RepID=UPI001CF93043|nr:hypothetical protein [Acidovorax radicis]UCV00734.1 hypothetical protein KI609_08280 [Acidovorax radicis]